MILFTGINFVDNRTGKFSKSSEVLCKGCGKWDVYLIFNLDYVVETEMLIMKQRNRRHFNLRGIG